MKSLWGERLAGLSFIALALFMGVVAMEFPAGGARFPLFISTCMVLLGSLMLLKSVLRPTQYRRRFSPDLSRDTWKPVGMLMLAILYVLGIFLLGYYVSTTVFLFVVPFAAGLKRPLVVAGSTALCVLFIYGLFGFALQVNFPSGIFF
ncbi:MAG: tripartite tricarboxylate transporter TctB family protein [Gammaproteobacteria bacterium]|nr:tripartite tricarboxylate transporter TctB family protein [Gammaproteobacteria bacterium]